MPTIKHFEDIYTWKKARELAVLVHKITEQGPFAKDISLKNQIRRAAVSVMSNIAEGFESQTQAQFVQYLGHAKSNAGEVRSLLIIASDYQYLTKEQFELALHIANKVIRQSTLFMEYLESHPESRRKSDEGVEYMV